MNITFDRIAAFSHALVRRPHGPAVAKDRAAASRTLAKGQTFGTPSAFGSSIECLTGKLWITHDGDPKDIVLEAGQRYSVDRRSKMLVHALSDSVFRQRGASQSALDGPNS